MIPDFLSAIGQALRDLAAFTNRGEVTDATLTELAGVLDRAHHLVMAVQGKRAPANQCARHPDGPIDPTAENGCLLCGRAERSPARPMPDGVEPGEVLQAIAETGHEAATHRYGARAVARALAIAGRHPAHQRPGQPAARRDTEGERRDETRGNA
ncbi:hypothetical protein AB0952_09050 [Streptomyces caniferus]|uniref:hypothetical protein n=1 Tax=Streptomyces caniferus TaxID=285557 RepID=UPI0034542393